MQMIKRFLRTARSLKCLQEIRRNCQPKLSKEKIGQRIQSLYTDYEVEESSRSFTKNLADASELLQPNDSSPLSIIHFIKTNIRFENMLIYEGSVPSVVFTINSSVSRKAAAESIIKTFKPFFTKRYIPTDGLTTKVVDWIVLDLKTIIIHIFEPQKRTEVDLDTILTEKNNVLVVDDLNSFKKMSNLRFRSQLQLSQALLKSI